MPDKLPEEFAPTGPKLSRFPIQPAPPIRPRLFPDEARFAFRLAILAGAAECAVWTLLLSLADGRAVLLLAAVRLFKPAWAHLGTRVPRPLVGLIALPAVADLCATTIGDSVTVERRAAAYAWLDMAQALGAALGIAAAALSPWIAAGALALALIGIPQLHDRGTPRSAWPLAAYWETLLGTPLAGQLALLAFGAGVMSAGSPPQWSQLALPLAGMAIASRLESRMPNAIWLPRIALLLGLGGLYYPPLRMLGVGVMLAAIPAAVARGAGEMERPIVSSLAWTALFTGAAVGAVL